MEPRREPPPTPAPDQPTTTGLASRITGSETLTKLVPALIAARAEIPTVKKDQQNPHFKSKYVNLAGIHEAYAGPLKDNGLCLFQSTRWIDGGLWLNTTMYHTSGEWVAFDYPVFANYGKPQELGSAITYSRRYSLMTILDIATEDDDGETASGRGPQRQQQPQGRRDARPDDRRRQQDQDRRGINQAFQEHAVTGEGPPVSPRNREGWSDFISRTLRAENDRWNNTMIVEGVSPELRRDHHELANPWSMVNHLCTRLIELGRLTAEDIGKDGRPSIRDKDKALRAVVEFYAHSPASIRKAVHKHLAEKQGELRAKLGMVDMDDDADAEPVGAQSREPGEDG